MRKAQGAFEYILLLGGVLLIVAMVILILRSSLTRESSRVDLITCKVQLIGVQACINSTGGWTGNIEGVADGCASGCAYADYRINPSCADVFAGPPQLSWYYSPTQFKCGPYPI
ncbi:MAG TPA: class III signal peptide-containing protein [Candidatus Norongarragalinales archaeon]|nr:class III signal peptide-containing protein [Candidatus Norongarragalinales archaeon]